MSFPKYRVGIGKNSHRFLPAVSAKPCRIGGLVFEELPGLAGDSDGDVIFHALCNALSSVSCVPILTGIARELREKDGITDSQVYLEKGLEILGMQKIKHISISLEGKKPRFEPRLLEMRYKIASILGIDVMQVGITAHGGDGLTDFGCGDGVECTCILTTVEEVY